MGKRLSRSVGYASELGRAQSRLVLQWSFSKKSHTMKSPCDAASRTGAACRRVSGQSDSHWFTAHRGTSEVLWPVIPSTETRKQVEFPKHTPLAEPGTEPGSQASSRTWPSQASFHDAVYGKNYSYSWSAFWMITAITPLHKSSRLILATVLRGGHWD